MKTTTQLDFGATQYFAVWKWNGAAWECERRHIFGFELAQKTAEVLTVQQKVATKITRAHEDANCD